MSRTSVAMFDRLMPQDVACLERYFQLFQPWICRAVVEVVGWFWRGVSREGMDERGSNSFFSLRKLGNFIFLNQENSILICFLDIAGLSDPQPSIDRGIRAFFWMLVFLEGRIADKNIWQWLGPAQWAASSMAFNDSASPAYWPCSSGEPTFTK